MQKTHSFFTTARTTGLLYLGLAITGIVAFLYAKERLYVAFDPMATAENLRSQAQLARIGIAAELALVAFQAIAAVWFFRLFYKIHLTAALGLALFGTVNAILILISGAFWLQALETSQQMPLSTEIAATVLQLFNIHEVLWLVGKLFFGLWLIPMGYLSILAHMPRGVTWFLIGGGVGYMLSLLLNILAPEFAPSAVKMMTIPATIGEFWMIGYLLFKPKALDKQT